ncbi:MAG: hypothetical protein K1X94_18880 [Sandaracinaceae bacterium]|nr:hypothetical protein [Sandaracinaceae bacterium]
MRQRWITSLGVAAMVWSGAEAASAQAFSEASLQVRLFNPDAEGGYQVRVNGEFFGLANPNDRVRLTVKQGQRTLATQLCTIDDRNGTYAHLSCDTDQAPRMTATGAVSIELAYEDDMQETTTVVRTVNANVRGYPYWVHDRVVGTMYQLDGGSLVGSAFAYMSHRDDTPRVQLFTAFAGTYEGFDSSLRCRVGEERIPDIEVSTLAFGEIEVDEWTSQEADRRHVAWYRARLEMNGLWWGPNVPGASAGWSGPPVFLGDHPGLWSCDMRSEGVVLRTFRFQVDAQGQIVAHAAETAPGMPRMIDGLHMVDVRFPATNPRDAFFDPAAIRAGYQYGIPWSSPAAVAEMLGALPAAAGSSAPTGRGGGGGGARRRR